MTILRRHRKMVWAGILLLCVMLLATGCLTASQRKALDVMNWDRGRYSRRVLPAHGSLQRKAQAWAEKIARDNRLSHSSLASGVPSCWRGLAENVGYGASIVHVQAAYMASAGHRANILNTSWDHAGVGVARNGSRVFTVQVFMDGC